ncbi:hypothetical protein BDZ94DRAFT_1242700 [Collybia nuda]|uniref:Uncharacterized protein n=1 Tax=Collybia nuda TaxID=64659 RepID=A0A9P5YIJ8_9AGAR|nr:hypothetical protein BDZ94DRAFT_1242700 [Collybia nuda]
MAPVTVIMDDAPSSPDTEDQTINGDLVTPTTQSGETSPCLDGEGDDVTVLSTQKKKKKKKPKKSAKAKEAATAASKAKTQDPEGGRPPVLRISRNKHWRYISSYHGPWLQLPIELLESLLVLNLDPATLSAPESRLPPLPAPPMSVSASKQRDRGYHTLADHSPPASPRGAFSTLPLPPPFPTPKPGKATPPPIDPGVFRSVTSIRRLIDEAAELSVRASSGLSAAELGSMRTGSGYGGSPWAAAQSLGINPMGNNGGGGRNVAMSAMRIHRLRALAVQKLAQAYKADEIASSVMVMQGGSVFDDVAERVLKNDPYDLDAKYVHFFHEKIPSRQLAESTTTKILDELIAAEPQRLEYYRTRGIVQCFRDEYPQATKDFTYALKEARAARRARMIHNSLGKTHLAKNGKRRKGAAATHTNGQAPPDGTSPMPDNMVEGFDGEPLLLHPSVLPDAPLQQVVFLIEEAVLKLEGVRKALSADGAELRLCYLENGKYGGVEMGHPDGPLGKRDGPKVLAYKEALGEKTFKDQISNLLRKSIRDHEKFLSHFDSLESPNAMPDGDIAHQTEYAFLLSESIRPGNHSNLPPPMNDAPAMFTTYHPLLVESHFSVLICQLMLADFVGILPTFARTASLVDGLEGYPVFLPPRSMGQAEFIEVLERLASGWKQGVQPHSLSALRGKGRLAIEAPPPLRTLSPTDELDDDCTRASSSSSTSKKNSSANGEGSSAQHVPDVPHVNESRPAPRVDGAQALDCARILLAPVLKRQREKAEWAAAEKAAGGSKKKNMSINIPLHGPRVEVVLAWLGAVHLPELDKY